MIEIKGTNKILKTINYIVFGVLVMAETAFCGMLIYTGFLPFRFLCIAIAIFAMITFLFAFGAFKGRNVIISICLVLELACLGGLGVAFNYLLSTQIFLNEIQVDEYSVEEYYIIVKKDAVYQEVDELKDKKVATYTENWENYQSAVKKMNEITTFETNNYNDVIDASVAMLNGEVDAVLVRGSIKETIGEIIPEWNDENIRILYTIEIKTKNASYDKGVNISEVPFNVLISGIDTYGDISTVSRSDVNMIMTINPKTYEILLTSIPRDCYVQLHGTTGPKDKLTHSGMYGIDMTRTTLEDFFNIKIDYSVRVNFNTLVDLVDIIGGITIIPDKTFRGGSNCYFVRDRENELDGQCALAYSRERHAYSTGDNHRILNQQDVLEAMINKMTSSKTLMEKYFEILNSISGSLETTIPAGQFYKFANLQLEKMPHWNIKKISIEGDSKYDVTYSLGSQLLYVMLPEDWSIEAARTEMERVLKEGTE